MANSIRFLITQGKNDHLIETSHSKKLNKIEIWLDRMIKKYPELKIYISLEMSFEQTWQLEWDKSYNLIKLTENNFYDKGYYDFIYTGSNTFYYKNFPDKEVNMRKLKLNKINNHESSM